MPSRAVPVCVQMFLVVVAAACGSSSVAATPSPQDIRPYQTLVAKDYSATVASASNHCDTIQDKGCKGAYEAVRAKIEAWLNDLNKFSPPPRFEQIDTMLRHHLAQAMVEGDAGIAAQQAGNSTLFDTAFTAHFNERGLIDAISGAVANTRVVTAAGYKSIVQDQQGQYTSCTPCAAYGGSAAVSCSGTRLYNCVDDVVAMDAEIYNFESALAQNAAPPSLASQDTALQTDLVSADAALMAMITAGLSGDLSAFSTARGSLQVAISGVSTEAGAVSQA